MEYIHQFFIFEIPEKTALRKPRTCFEIFSGLMLLLSHNCLCPCGFVLSFLCIVFAQISLPISQNPLAFSEHQAHHEINQQENENQGTNLLRFCRLAQM